MDDRHVQNTTSISHRLRSGASVLLKGIWKPLFVIALIALFAWIIQPGRLVREIAEAREWIDDHAPWSIAVFLLLYIIASVAIVPISLLKVTAGGLFGPVLGVVIASIGSTCGATACFLIARYIASGSLMQRMKQNEHFRKLDALTERHGAIIVALARLLPILPGNLVNYAFGLTHVRLGVFMLWSWLGMLPSSIILVVGTNAFVQGLRRDRVPWGLLSIVAGALTIAAIAVYAAYRNFKAHQISDPEKLEYTDV